MLYAIFAVLTLTGQDQSPERPDTYSVYSAILNGNWNRLEELKRRIPSFKHPILKGETFSDVLTMLASTGGGAGTYANALTGMRICIEHGADPNEGGGAPLSTAAYSDAWGKMVERLLESGANPNPSKQWSPLIQATLKGRAQNVRILLRYGANPNLPSKFSPNIWWGYSKPGLPGGPMLPLSFAARRGQGEILLMLLKSGAKVNAKDANTGMTALHEAAEADQGKIITLLLRARADRSVRDRKGRTALNLARLRQAKSAIRAFG